MFSDTQSALNRAKFLPKSFQVDYRQPIKFLDRTIEPMDQKLGKIIVSEQLKTVPGVSKLLTTTLIAELPELGNLNPKEIAVLVGITPFNRGNEEDDFSAEYDGKRRCFQGRA
ncbi:transposase [Microbulbifer spongiae]|uniref:Transposase n=1 Tax=Microbulbifer spongiae TaxID=2944933 RepID=A0ABY9EG91_9GAMM|nr:transposase [Microbulbifer sp. MI-G]WKD49806.1 transposase [Microbulbifer sp. MI-G]